jgi:hypothetical protein
LRLSRKYIGLIIIGILILIFVVYNLTSTPNDYKITSNNMSTNNFVGYGVSFNFPSDWNLTTDNNGFDSSQGIIITVSPNEENDEAPLFEVLIMPNQGMSDQDAINAAINTSTNPSSWHLISNKTTTIDNNTAYVNTFTVDDPADFTENMTLEQMNIVKKGNTYTLMIQTPVNDFNNNQANFNTMINSIKIE